MLRRRRGRRARHHGSVTFPKTISCFSKNLNSAFDFMVQGFIIVAYWHNIIVSAIFFLHGLTTRVDNYRIVLLFFNELKLQPMDTKVK